MLSVRPSAIPKPLKSPSQIIYEDLTLFAPRKYKEATTESKEKKTKEVKQAIKEPAELKELIKKIDAITKTITESLAGAKTRLMELSSKKDASHSIIGSAQLKEDEQQELAERRRQLEAAKFHAYVQMINAAFEKTADTKLQAILSDILKKAATLEPTVVAAEAKSHSEYILSPLEWLMTRTMQMAAAYEKLQQSGDYAVELANLPNVLQKLLQDVTEEYTADIDGDNSDEEYMDEHPYLYDEEAGLPDSDSDDEFDERENEYDFETISEYLKKVGFAPQGLPKDDVRSIAIVDAYPAHMVNNIHEIYKKIYESKQSSPVKDDLVIETPPPLFLCRLYYEQIKSGKIQAPKVSEKDYDKRILIHNLIIQQFLDFKKMQERKLEYRNKIKEQMKTQLREETKAEMAQKFPDIQKTLLTLFVTHVLEKRYKAKLKKECQTTTIRKLFSTQKTPENYIDFLNKNMKGHHLHRMLVITLNDIYINYSHMLPDKHPKLYTAGIVCPPEYGFEGPVTSIRVAAQATKGKEMKVGATRNKKQ